MRERNWWPNFCRKKTHTKKSKTFDKIGLGILIVFKEGMHIAIIMCNLSK